MFNFSAKENFCARDRWVVTSRLGRHADLARINDSVRVLYSHCLLQTAFAKAKTDERKFAVASAFETIFETRMPI